jgi:hypothetical protein
MRQLKHSCWDVADILEMCHDAEQIDLDAYAQGFVDDIRKRVIKWGMTMALSDKQEMFLMTIATKGLQDQQRRDRYAKKSA